MPILLAWARTGASPPTNTPGSSPRTTWPTLPSIGLSFSGKSSLFPYVIIPPSGSANRLMSKTDVGSPNGSWLGYCKYSPGGDDQPWGNHCSAVLDRSFRSWLYSRRCLIPLILLPSIRDGLSLWPIHLVLPYSELLCFCAGIWNCSCEDLARSMAAFVHYW